MVARWLLTELFYISVGEAVALAVGQSVRQCTADIIEHDRLDLSTFHSNMLAACIALLSCRLLCNNRQLLTIPIC